MAPYIVPQKSIHDLWARAAEGLSDSDKQNINFNRPDKLNILAELHAAAESSKAKSIKERWKYTRKSGETVIIRDVCEKIVHWVDVFKQVGDIAVQYDTAHASLPWAAVRLILQITVNDFNRFTAVVEDLAQIAELICRHVVTESLYIQGASEANKVLEPALVRLYAKILGYLSTAKRYLEQRTTKRLLAGVVLDETQLVSALNDIRSEEDNVDRCMALVDRNDRLHDHAKLMQCIDVPFRRMSAELKNIDDKLELSRRREILQWISNEPYIQYHNQAKEGVLTGTGRWLLSDPVFKRWKDDSASSILWLHGIPGSGKSKLVSIVIEDAIKSFRAGDIPHPVYFYCSRNPGEPTRSEPSAILASIARQLSGLGPGGPLLSPTVKVYADKEEEAFASGSLRIEDSCSLILKLIERHSLTTIIIDAMDECDPRKRGELLNALTQILRDSSNLVKVFVSSRNDHDIVLRLKDYPNLEIESQRNSSDIAMFVKSRTRQLIQHEELLCYSDSKAEMEKFIVEKVIEGASGMFRWASMQLQYICSFDIDADIKDCLGRLPPDLHTLYTEIYGMLTSKPGKFHCAIVKNILHWLLCAQRTLSTEEFLAAVSVDLQTGNGYIPMTKDLVLKICNNFVVFDSQLDTFRFAHLSVREFLEKRSEYASSISNALVAKYCLCNIFSISTNHTTMALLRELGWRNDKVQSQYLRAYSIWLWAPHCKLAYGERRSGTLRVALHHMLSGDGEATSVLSLWKELAKQSLFDSDGQGRWERHIVPYLSNLINSHCPANYLGLQVCCIFDLEEQVTDLLRTIVWKEDWEEGWGTSPLQYAVTHMSHAALSRLLAYDGYSLKDLESAITGLRDTICKRLLKPFIDWQGPAVVFKGLVLLLMGRFREEVIALLHDRREADILMTEDVVKAAVRNSRGAEVMAYLLARRGADIFITEEVVKAAIQNIRGVEVMTVLLDWRAADIPLTNGVVMEAAGNINGPEVIALLLDRRGADISITEETVKAAIPNSRGAEVISILLDWRGADIAITEEVVKAAAGDFNGEAVLALLLNRRRAEIKITEAIVAIAAENDFAGKRVLRLLFEQQQEIMLEIFSNSKVLNRRLEKLSSTLWRIRCEASWVYFRQKG
ncbi:hypothetical protein BKA66DRAFT_175722 [Pyrenochaeta sp. MPI-SDFR-AT-0127]|nr:hypothetical protein BKA66DRAFT_175722 [Pyrenochaeta sp. MPI-SDFR-AT-0127]